MNIASPNPKNDVGSCISAQQLARVLMRNVPSRGWDYYEGLDEVLTTHIRIAEKCQLQSGAASLSELYGSDTIIDDMKQLRAALRKLAYKDNYELNKYAEQAIARGREVLERLICYTLYMKDLHLLKDPGHVKPCSDRAY